MHYASTRVTLGALACQAINGLAVNPVSPEQASTGMAIMKLTCQSHKQRHCLPLTLTELKRLA